MAYRLGQRVKRDRKSIKRYLAGISAAAVIATGAAVPALAASNDYCGSSVNGCTQSSTHTDCAGHGSFGAFGTGNNFAGGASGDRTAYNNSGLCGNPSDNSAAATLGDTPNQ